MRATDHVCGVMSIAVGQQGRVSDELPGRPRMLSGKWPKAGNRGSWPFGRWRSVRVSNQLFPPIWLLPWAR
jgi:hypothetical protein